MMVPERLASLNLRADVNKLWFPVKLWALIGLFLISLLDCACGYQPAYAPSGEGERLGVVPAAPLVTEAGALESTLAGVREELARAGRLRSGTAPPRLVVELVRVEEVAAGLSSDAETARARGTRVAVVGRAWIEREPSSPPERDTGDMQRVESYAPETDLRVEGVRYEQALRSAGRELGRALAARVMGYPTPASDPL